MLLNGEGRGEKFFHFSGTKGDRVGRTGSNNAAKQTRFFVLIPLPRDKEWHIRPYPRLFLFFAASFWLSALGWDMSNA